MESGGQAQLDEGRAAIAGDVADAGDGGRDGELGEGRAPLGGKKEIVSSK